MISIKAISNRYKTYIKLVRLGLTGFALFLLFSIALFGCSATKRSAEEIFNKAKTYQKQEKYEQACRLYQQLLDTYPDSVLAEQGMVNLGKCLRNLGKLDEVINLYKSYLSKYPLGEDIPYVTGGIAEIYFEKKEYDKSLEWSKKVREDYPDFRQDFMLYLMGNNYQSLNKDKQAISIYSDLIQTYPESEYLYDAYNHLAMCYEKLADVKKEKESFNKIIVGCKDRATLSWAYYGLSVIKLNEGNKNGAIADLKLIVQKFPETNAAKEAKRVLENITNNH